ncbi:hypothetical protein H5410_052133 [Solanum commersonii]|uniref:CCHC-type domain-containing protein n=1 Tax=Solanum commersonii TaxID=4109 RepID=A0A9J5X0J5_SOLCO|nr:hypothetical protein H5410_052133 [Solanum commersonii]
MVAEMRSRMNMFVAGLSHLSSKEGKSVMLIGDMDKARLMIQVEQVEEDKLRDSKEFKNKRAKTSVNEFEQQKSNANWCSFQQKQKGPSPSSVSAPVPKNKGMCCDGSIGCYKCGQNGHFMRECPKNRQGNGNRGTRA